jgi:iron(III) transport system substrate-binding protein
VSIAVGITIESSAYEFVVGGQKEIKLVYPSEGTYLGAEGMFIIKGPAERMQQPSSFTTCC